MPDAPRDLKLDADGDLLFVGGDLVLTSGADSILQDAECRLRLIRGEWFLAPAAGVDWFGEIFVKNPSLPRIQAILTEALLATPGIVDVLEMPLALDTVTRRLTGTFRATTDVGEIITGTIGAAQ